MPHKHSTRKEASNLDYLLMSFSFKIRDFLRPRGQILKEVGIKTCCKVLDYGCGPGGYVLPVVKIIGNLGRLFALDVNPLAIDSVQKLVTSKKLANVKTILSDCDSGLPPASIDVVLLYDILHDLDDHDKVLVELHRVLQPEGVLSVSDHHLEVDDIVSRVTKSGLFKLKSKGEKTFSFLKIKNKQEKKETHAQARRSKSRP
jgi:ubiquinone/menaquinone biosynthesis C-methylase UbiE